MKVKKLMNLGFALVFTFFAVQLLPAQEIAEKSLQETESDPEKKTNKPKFAAIPIPNYNQTTGFGLGAIVGLFYPVSKTDEVSPPSSTMFFGFYAENKTNVFGVYKSFI